MIPDSVDIAHQEKCVRSDKGPTVLAHGNNPLFDLPAGAAYCGERLKDLNRLAAVQLSHQQVILELVHLFATEKAQATYTAVGDKLWKTGSTLTAGHQVTEVHDVLARA